MVEFEVTEAQLLAWVKRNGDRLHDVVQLRELTGFPYEYNVKQVLNVEYIRASGIVSIDMPHLYFIGSEQVFEFRDYYEDNAISVSNLSIIAKLLGMSIDDLVCNVLCDKDFRDLDYKDYVFVKVRLALYERGFTDDQIACFAEAVVRSKRRSDVV